MFRGSRTVKAGYPPANTAPVPDPETVGKKVYKAGLLAIFRPGQPSRPVRGQWQRSGRGPGMENYSCGYSPRFARGSLLIPAVPVRDTAIREPEYLTKVILYSRIFINLTGRLVFI